MGVRDIWRNFGGREAVPLTVPGGLAAPDVFACERLALLDSFEQAGLAWFWASDARGRFTYLSAPAAAQVAPDRSLLGTPVTAVLQPGEGGHAPSGDAPLSDMLSQRAGFTGKIVRVVTAANTAAEPRWAISGQPQFDGDGTFTGYRGIIKDMTGLAEEESRPGNDPLTGLANRDSLNAHLGEELDVCRTQKCGCALLVLDLDRFKQVNDTLGRQAGDDLLRHVAQRIERSAPAGAWIGRLDADQFQVIVPGLDDRGKLGDSANRLIQAISQPYSLDGRRATVGVSIGIAVVPFDGDVRGDILKAAGLALRAAKRGGRGQFRFYSKDLAVAAQDRRAIAQDLREAIADDGLEMHYQPQVDVAEHRIRGFEALLRWEHPRHGPVSPGTFLSIAEENDMLGELGSWALRRACLDAAAWPGTLPVSVNISAREFLSEDLPDIVENALVASGLPPSRLELEINEGVFLSDIGTAQSTFAVLRRLGVKLALDDFGTGYSALSALRQAPFQRIKIDRSFVRECTDERGSGRAMIEAIAAMARALGMQTTAGGVEAMDELAIIGELDIDLVQGFIFSRAVPHVDVVAKLKSGDLHYEPVGPATHRAERRPLQRRVGVVHDNHRYVAVLRDLSRKGARIEGLLDVPVGTELVLDLGEGQLVPGRVRRSQDATQGVEFAEPLVSDGAGGLCTRHRMLHHRQLSAEMALHPQPAPGHIASAASGLRGRSNRPRFMQVDVGGGASRAG